MEFYFDTVDVLLQQHKSYRSLTFWQEESVRTDLHRGRAEHTLMSKEDLLRDARTTYRDLQQAEYCGHITQFYSNTDSSMQEIFSLLHEAYETIIQNLYSIHTLQRNVWNARFSERFDPTMLH